MTTILLDVNVFEDVFRQRTGWEASLAVIASVANGQVVGHVSALTPPILFFRRGSRGEKGARQAVRGMLAGFRIAALDRVAIEAAYDSELPDFEDALQFLAADRATVDAIVTRNKKHFRQSKIRVLSPEEAIDAIRET